MANLCLWRLLPTFSVDTRFLRSGRVDRLERSIGDVFRGSSTSLRQNLGSDLSLSDLATLAHLSSGHFSGAFGRSVGMSPISIFYGAGSTRQSNSWPTGICPSPRSLRRWGFQLKATSAESSGRSLA